MRRRQEPLLGRSEQAREGTRWGRRLPLLAFGLILSALLFAACGGGSTSSSSSEATSAETTGGEPAEESAFEAPITDPNVPENAITEPLPEKPPAGKKVIFLQCELPACERFLNGMEESTKALGWQLETIVFPSADPGKGLETALSKNPDYIAMSGIPQEVIKSQMATAEKDGIPISSCSTVELGKPGGYLAQCGATLRPDAEELGKWMVQDSEGKAQIVGLTLPLFPVLGTETDYFEGEFLENCPECGYQSLDLTPEDLGEGKVGQKVVAALQQNPSIQYVYSTFADPTTGLRPVLDSAGFQDVKILTAAGNSTTTQEIPDKIAAATLTPNEYMSWQMVDALARYSVGIDVAKDKAYQETVSETPIYVLDSVEASERLKPFGYDWPGPGDGSYMQEFEELWQLK
jgi:ribose transport system substrate-binding protein